MGLACGIGAAAGVALTGDPGRGGALAVGLGTGVGGALVGAFLVYGSVRRQADAVGVLSTPVRRAAGRASLWGPVPEDPETRAAAYALTQHALEERRRRPVIGVVSALILLAMTVNLAVQASPRWWIAVAIMIGLLVYAWFVLPRRLRRRADLLRP